MKRALSGVLAALLLSLGLAPSAQAAGGFNLTLTRMTPQWLATPDSLQLTLNIDASQPFGQPSVLEVRQTSRPLVGRADIATVMSGKAKFDLRFVRQFDTGVGLNQGANTFSLTLDPTDLQFSGNGVYLLHLTATSGSTRAAIDVLLPYFNAQAQGTFKPLQVLPLWTVAAPPSLNMKAQYLSQDAVNAFSDKGAVGAVVKAAAGRADLTWLIDPDTVWTAQRIAGGGEILGDTLDVVSAEQSAAAASWLESLKVSTFESDVYSLPYVNAEVKIGRAHV